MYARPRSKVLNKMAVCLRLGVAGVLCSLVGIACYLNTLDCGFCFDDDAAVENNKDLRPNESWTNLLWDDFWGTPMADKDSHKSYRPLCVATFRLNYLLHELQPMGYHLVNVLLHGAVCYLYVQLCGVVFSGAVWPALIAGLLFAVHPIHTEAVAGLVGRADVLSGIFFISTLLLYRKSAIATASMKGWLYFLLCVGSCLCAAVSKETGLTAAALCLLYEAFLLRKLDLSSGLDLLRWLATGQWRRIPSWFTRFFVRSLLLLSFTIVFLYVRVKLNKGPPIFSINNNPAMFEPSPFRQLHWAYLTAFNSWLLLCPAHLSAEYAMGTIPLIKSITDPRNALTLLTLLSLVVIVLLGVTRSRGSQLWRAVLFAASSLVIPFLPASNLFFPVGFVVAERVLYLPSMGFCMLVAIGCWHLLTSLSKHTLLKYFVKLSLFYLLAMHTTKTVVRNRAWFSSINLFSSAISIYPNNGKMMSNYAAQLDLAGTNRTLAIAMYKRAITLEPHLVTGYMNLAFAQREVEQYLDALETYRSAAELVTRNLEGDKRIHITPKNIRVYNSLSNMLREHGNDLPGALHYGRKAVEWEPDLANSHNTLANALLAMEAYREAKVEFERALELNPEMGVAHSNLGECLLKTGDVGGAEGHFRQALAIEPNHTLTKFRLATVAIKLDTPSKELLYEAESLLEDVLSIEPDNGNASFSLGLIYYDLHNYTEAERWFLRSLELTPNDPGSLYNLGVMFTGLNKYGEAVVYLEMLREHHPSHVNGLCQLATCHMQLGHRDKAKELFQLVLSANPNNTMALQNYGLLLIHEKDYPGATTQFERLHRLDPSNSAIKQQLDNLLKHKEKKKSAKKT